MFEILTKSGRDGPQLPGLRLAGVLDEKLLLEKLKPEDLGKL